ncbi:hypothetical protein B0T17DRAFT_514389 [Bombardia bombarda]|uniref:Ribosomal protein S15 n=1 Tax=Bombardia bombarda TaxID=252184 RepID=A0AA39XIU4_9PEZI|nr:hypothetical protein B0T17DRAFT_514389 [Bombardia bombarda]
MPPRIPGPQGLRSLSLCLRPSTTTTTTTTTMASSLQPFIQTANLSRKEKTRRMKQDPHGWAASQQRKSINLKRREELQVDRDASWGSPVHGIPTAFVESFDSAGQAPLSTPPVDEDGNPLSAPRPLPTSPHLLNYLLSKAELDAAISQAEQLTRPYISPDRATVDPRAEQMDLEEHQRQHAKALVAIERIASLQNASAKDRKHANIRRCIEEFGRHNTDHTLERPAPPLARGVVPGPQPVRAGPDTGSSEVQIAILTSKIRALASKLEGPKGNRDKNNKRSLRLLCHKRQRLLRYMERKERGSGRWVHMLETLGLTPATWKEQITL